MIKKTMLSVAIFLGIVAYAPATVQAVDIFRDVCRGYSSADPDSPTVCRDRTIGRSNPIFGPDGILTKVINLLSIIVGVAAVIGIIMSGIKFITSAGTNAQELNAARELLIYALVGLVLAASAQLIVRVFLSRIGT